MQPPIGLGLDATLKAMGRRSKRDKPDPVIRGVLAHNVTVLRDRAYAAKPSVTSKNKALAKDADTTLSQIQRILSGELGTSVDLIARLARALQVRPQDLLVPYFGEGPRETVGDGPNRPRSKAKATATATAVGS